MLIRTLILLSLSFLSVEVFSQTADEIISKSNLAAIYPSADGRAEARMLIVDKQGRKQIRQFKILRKNIEKGGDQQYLLRFTRPSDVAKTGFLVVKHRGSDDDRWLYLPGLDLVKRISAGDKRTSFVGSNFFYEDISGRDIDEDKFELLSSDAVSWLLKASPKDNSLVEFSSYQVSISKDNHLPLEVNYYDRNGEIYRRITAEKIRVIDGISTIVQMRASNLRNGSYTITQMRNVEFDIGVPSSVFSERALRMPPKKWLN